MRVLSLFMIVAALCDSNESTVNNVYDQAEAIAHPDQTEVTADQTQKQVEQTTDDTVNEVKGTNKKITAEQTNKWFVDVELYNDVFFMKYGNEYVHIAPCNLMYQVMSNLYVGISADILFIIYSGAITFRHLEKIAPAFLYQNKTMSIFYGTKQFKYYPLLKMLQERQLYQTISKLQQHIAGLIFNIHTITIGAIYNYEMNYTEEEEPIQFLLPVYREMKCSLTRQMLNVFAVTGPVFIGVSGDQYRGSDQRLYNVDMQVIYDTKRFGLVGLFLNIFGKNADTRLHSIFYRYNRHAVQIGLYTRNNSDGIRWFGLGHKKYSINGQYRYFFGKWYISVNCVVPAELSLEKIYKEDRIITVSTGYSNRQSNDSEYFACYA